MEAGRFDQVVIMSAFAGVAVLLLPEGPRKRLTQIFQDLSELMSKIVSIVMILAPYGIFALVANSVGKYGSKIFGTLAKYIGSVYLGILCMTIFYGVMVYLFAGVGFKEFYRKASSIMVTAFSTCSSTSSIPVNMECADKLGVPRKVSSFTIPLGAQVNKDGTCVCLTTVFILTAQAIGAPVDLGLLVKVLVLGLILTTGSGAIPSGMLVILAILLESLGFPLEIVGIVAGVHAFNDMGMAIEAKHLKALEGTLQPADILLLYTGWAQKRGFNKEYLYQWPYITKDAAQWMVDQKIKCVCIDGLSAGGWPEGTGAPPHFVLLGNHIVIIEEVYMLLSTT